MNAAYIPVILAGISIAVGVFFLICEMLGVYRFRYALARMHAAALGDTGGLFSSCSVLSYLTVCRHRP